MQKLFIFILLSTVSLKAFSQERLQYTFADPQKMQLIDSGVAALQKRFEMIATAKKTIDIEYFIYNTDKVGRLFTQALIEKAQKDHIKIRLLVDSSIAVFQLKEDYAAVIQSAVKEGLLEIRYYNKTSFFNVVGAQFRSHRKSLIIDGENVDGQGMTGGRNIAEEYFDLSPTYNFLDTDLYVQGTLVRAMKKSFEDFWESGLTVAAPKTPSADSKSVQKAKEFITSKPADAILLKKINRSGRQMLKTQVTSVCTDSSFVADGIDKSPNSPVYRAAIQEILAAQESVAIESPYFVVSYDGLDFLKDVMNIGQKVKLQLLTNSLNSTDATYTSAALYPYMSIWRNLGIRLHLYRGNPPQNYPTPVAEALHTRWGTHSKRAVMDGSTILVGTYNADPRSKDINVEMAVVCRHNKVLGKAIQDNFRARLKQSIEINRLGLPADGRVFSDVGLLKGLQFGLFLIPANLFSFLL
ncbi:MAG TPA: phosphatidylserine/phosphatidylglycerophosphate/cardiolipin synthase family protein [Pseudobdellovibrionaceae bacterium]|jgi:putative cardiolipin synthase